MFRDRTDAGMQLAARLKGRAWQDPLVLAVPRGGVAVGAVLARELGAELDVVLARKLRAPGQPELAVGAVCESGEVFLNRHAREYGVDLDDYLACEVRHQRAEIRRRQTLFRTVRPQAPVAGRSVLLTDDGIATGSTLLAALRVARARGPRELVVAVPVAAPERAAEVRAACDELVCLHEPPWFWAIGQFYEDFRQVEDDEVVDLLRRFGGRPAGAGGGVGTRRPGEPTDPARRG